MINLPHRTSSYVNVFRAGGDRAAAKRFRYDAKFVRLASSVLVYISPRALSKR